MKTFYITTGVLALAALTFAQSSAPVATPTGTAVAPSAAAPADARISNSHIHLFTKDPEVQRHFWVDIMGATAAKMGSDRDAYTLPKVLVIVDKGNPTAGTEYRRAVFLSGPYDRRVGRPGILWGKYQWLSKKIRPAVERDCNVFIHTLGL